jgi:hypothetical protein
VEFAQPSDGGRAAINSCRASRAQTIQRLRHEAHGRDIARERQRTLHVPFHVVEIQRFARNAPLLRPARTRRNPGKRFNFLEVAALLPAVHDEFFADLE